MERALSGIPREKLDNRFRTLQTCMKETMICSGSDSYKFVHMNKDRLRQESRFPVSIICDQNVLPTGLDVASSDLFRNIDVKHTGRFRVEVGQVFMKLIYPHFGHVFWANKSNNQAKDYTGE